MAFRTQKISQMTPKGANLEATDLIEVSTIESGSYVTRSLTGQEIIDAAVGNVDWGDIGGTLSAQTDLQNALDAKVPTSRTLTINGVTQDLSANRTFTISTGITIGSTAIASGTVGRILFEGTGNVVQESSGLTWNESTQTFQLTNGGIIQIGTNLALTANVSELRFTYASANVMKIRSTQVIIEQPLQFTSGGSPATIRNAFSNTGIQIGVNGSTSATTSTYFATTGNVLIGTTTDAGFKLDVNGTARVSGNTTVSLNQNGVTLINASNTTSGTAATAELRATTGGGFIGLGKYSASTNSYKFIASSDSYLYNATIGDIAIINDFATGRIKFGAGGSSTAQATLFSTGNLAINTTTDAGYRLDVNGTARVSQDLTLVAGNAIRFGTSLGMSKTANQMLIYGGTGAGNAGGTDVHYWNGSTYVVGLRLNNNANVLIGTTTDGGSKLRVVGLPTSSAGLSAGDIWNDAGTLKIV